MDIIHLLPDEVANQIAAGEVVQRPASVIKELVENAIDAGAHNIQIIIKDAGRTLIQVIDDGKGMSPTDARMAFERHATSKITQANDLFALHTMGFRGEALASIAAVAQVELLTRTADAEMGSRLVINGGNTESEEPCACPQGSNFAIKNLFFNVPARRKFLKSYATEFSHIEKSFFCIALVYPDISFELIHNGERCFMLPATSLRERIVHIFGKSIDNQLFNIQSDTSLINIKGFVGKPESARKQNTDRQYFFVNGRFMRHPGFHKAVMQAYDRMLQPGTAPIYFIYMEVDPASIDVNIHPTKTEIKFENEQAIWPIVQATVREALGRFDATDAIDFDQNGAVDMPSLLTPHNNITPPSIHTDPDYNPFDSVPTPPSRSNQRNWQDLCKHLGNDSSHSGTATTHHSIHLPDGELVDTLTGEVLSSERNYQQHPTQTQMPLDDTDEEHTGGDFIQFQNRYIISAVKSGLMCIDQHRAHFRILFDSYLTNIRQHKCASQRLMYPEQIDLSPADSKVLEEAKDQLSEFGYDISTFGPNVFVVNGVPADNADDSSAKPFILGVIAAIKGEDMQLKEQMQERMAMALARTAAIDYGKPLQPAEMTALVNNLFACPCHATAPDGKTIITIIPAEELERKFK